MATGYSLQSVERIKKADSGLLGVSFGLLCLKNNISVSDVAEYFKISRPAVYAWFYGESIISGKHVDSVKKLIQKLS